MVVNDVDPVTVTADESKQFSLEKELESLVGLIYLLNTSAIHFKFTRSKWHLGYIVWATFGLHLGYIWATPGYRPLQARSSPGTRPSALKLMM